jgi:serine protease inhibitor
LENLPADQDLSQIVCALINTVSFSDEWVDRFNPDLTKSGGFNLANGQAVQVNYMNQVFGSKDFIQTEQYAASRLQFKNNGSMVFVLLAADQTPASILEQADWLQQIINQDNSQFGEVVFKVPKFDIKQDLANLPEILQKMGMNQAFNPETADFSPRSFMLAQPFLTDDAR